MNNKYDIFISYRRKDVGDKAEHLKDLLEPYYKRRISFDRENLSGKFNVALIERIAHVKDFLLVIGKNSFVYNDDPENVKVNDFSSKAYTDAFSPETVKVYDELAQCSQEECVKRIMALGTDFPLDYVRIEIGRALHRKGLHIIPVVPERTDKFNFSALELPPDIAGIKGYEAVFYSDNPDALFKRVVPGIRKHLKSRSDRTLQKVIGVAIITAILIIAGIVCAKKYFDDKAAFAACRTYADYYQYKQDGHRFFNDECMSAVTTFERLERGGFAYVNNTSFAEQKDSIPLMWSSDITLCQLKAIVGMLDSIMFIPSGVFIMGTDDNPLDNEHPAHKVTLTHDFYMSKYEVTRDEWFAVMGDSVVTDVTARLPITHISWNDCQQFINRLNGLTGLSFALPTEAQWEYAATGGGMHQQVAGDGNLNDVAWHRGNSMSRLHTTTESLAPNRFELYNMQGNAEEWCLDAAYVEYTASPTVDPIGPTEGAKHIVRGGSYLTYPDDMTITYRDAASTAQKSDSRGFRLVLNL